MPPSAVVKRPAFRAYCRPGAFGVGDANVADALPDRSVLALSNNPNLALVDELAQPRLELGLCIGLHAVEFMTRIVSAGGVAFHELITQRLDGLRHYLPIAGAVESFWSESDNQRSQTWRAHADINTVMLATSLPPDAYLRA